MKRILITLVIFIFNTCFINAAEVIDYRTRLSRQVLTSSNITAITKDSNGFIWIASSNELVRFDGASYHGIENSINKELFSNDNTVRQLYFQTPDILWIASNNGLYLYNIRKHSLAPIQALSGVRVYTIHPNRKEFYLNTNSGIIRYLPDANQVRYLYRYTKKNLPQEFTSLAIDTNGNCWLSANNQLLKLPSLTALEKQKSSNIKVDTIQKFKKNKRIKIDRYNNIWIWDRETLTTASITSKGGLENLTTQEIEISALLIKDNLVFLCKRSKENNWLHRDHTGKVTDKGIFLVSQQYDDLSSTTNVFYADNNNNIWIGTRDGLFMLPYKEKSRFINIRNDIKNQNTLSHNTISDVYIQGRNTAWIATAYGLNKITFKGSADRPYEIERFFDTRSSINYVLDNKIECISVNKEGEMWLGTKGNVKIYNPQKNIYYSKPVLEESLKHCSFVRALYLENDHDIWIGFENGGAFLYNMSDNMVSEIKTPASETVKCTAITGNNKGTVWIGTRSHGILRVNRQANGEGQSVKQYQIKDSVYNKPIAVNCIYTDKYNNVWIGADNGLYKYNYEKDTFIHMQISFFNGPKQITGLVNDIRGNLWMATLTGVYKYNISERNCQLITLYNGNFARQNFAFGGDIDSDGFIYMGGINGLTIFNPNEILYDTSHYKVLFTDFRIHNKTISVDSGILDQDINYSDKLVLNHNDNQFSFAFSALSYTNRENIRYSYMLEGLDDDWIFVGPEERYISYNNLPAGNYVLKIRCTNNSGIWLNNIHSLKIQVNPHLLKTWYFYLLYVILTGGIIWLMIYLWGLRLKLQSQTAMEQYKLAFYTDLIYSIKTPLTLLQSPLKNVITHYDAMSQDEIKYMLSTMNNNSNRLSLLIEQLAEFRDLSQGKVSLNLIETDFIPFVDGIYIRFKDLFESKNIVLKFVSAVNSISMVFDPEKLETILFHLLSNAYKIAQDDESFTLIINTSENKLWIELEGHSAADTASKINKAGIGLPLIKELIHLHHGQIYFNDLSANSLNIKFYLLTGSAHFSDFEIKQSDQTLEYPQMNHYLENESLSQNYNERYLPNATLVYMADEDLQIREFVNRVCRPSIRVLGFDNPENLYQEILKQKPKLVLSALVFEGQKLGLELCKKIKGNPATNDIPVMFVSSHSSSEDKNIGYECGADAYIAKPFDINHLKTRIMLLLQSNENIREKIKRELIMNPKEIQLQSADDKFLSKAMELIEKYIEDENFSVDQFASKMNISPSMLYRKIKSLTNLSPNELIRSVKLKRASQLLATKAYNISEVALKVGFTDIRYFSSCFKKEFGIPPSVYQQSTGNTSK